MVLGKCGKVPQKLINKGELFGKEKEIRLSKISDGGCVDYDYRHSYFRCCFGHIFNLFWRFKLN